MNWNTGSTYMYQNLNSIMLVHVNVAVPFALTWNICTNLRDWLSVNYLLLCRLFLPTSHNTFSVSTESCWSGKYLCAWPMWMWDSKKLQTLPLSRELPLLTPSTFLFLPQWTYTACSWLCSCISIGILSAYYWFQWMLSSDFQKYLSEDNSALQNAERWRWLQPYLEGGYQRVGGNRAQDMGELCSRMWLLIMLNGEAGIKISLVFYFS